MTIKLPKLNLPEYEFNYKCENNLYIYDDFRKKYIILTPEEWVRQNFLKYFSNEKKYPQSRIKLEYNININNTKKRCDAVYFNKNMEPEILMEFKAPTIKISQKTILQSDIYNINLRSSIVIISNGISHYFIKRNYEDKSFILLEDIPEY